MILDTIELLLMLLCVGGYIGILLGMLTVIASMYVSGEFRREGLATAKITIIASILVCIVSYSIGYIMFSWTITV